MRKVLQEVLKSLQSQHHQKMMLPCLQELLQFAANSLMWEIHFRRIVRQMPQDPGIPHGLLLASQTSTPRLTPPGSPPSLSTSVSPTRTSKPVSPRRHSVSFSTSRGMFDDRSSISSSDSRSQTGRTRVDGKELFRQVSFEVLLHLNAWLITNCLPHSRICFIRSRLSYEQFGAFQANVKELNSH
ncbi:hypothetical protein CRYUN_Cryun40dG0021700 [Craigia yunnanensis]